jgi:hypothetical protein
MSNPNYRKLITTKERDLLLSFSCIAERTHSLRPDRHSKVQCFMKAKRQVAYADPTFKEFAARLNLAQGKVVDVPVHEVNLDDPPSSRWAWVAQASEHYNKARALVLHNFVADPDNEPVPLWLNTVAQGMLQVVPAERREELDACARALGRESSDLVLINYLYELSAKCSSLVVERADGRPLHGRNLDWPGCQVLCDCTIRLRATRGGRLLYECLTWPGYLGVLTAVAPGRFSVSVNFRDQEKTQLPSFGIASTASTASAANTRSEVLRRVWATGKAAVLKGCSVGFLVRQVLESEEPLDFEQACTALDQAQLVAPGRQSRVLKRIPIQTCVRVQSAGWKNKNIHAHNSQPTLSWRACARGRALC